MKIRKISALYSIETNEEFVGLISRMDKSMFRCISKEISHLSLVVFKLLRQTVTWKYPNDFWMGKDTRMYHVIQCNESTF